MAESNKSESTWTPMIFVIVIFVVIVILVATSNMAGLIVLDYDLTSDDYTKILTTMFFIALLVERFIEVTVTVSRSEKKNILEADLSAAIKVDDAPKQKELNDQLIAHRNVTEKQAMKLGLLIGVLLGLAGVQVLGSLFDATNLQGAQRYLFKGMDVLLTAALIAGGSNGVKQVTSLFKNFLDAKKSVS